jgi:hypothetical protein
MSKPLAITLILALASLLGACDGDRKTPKTTAEKSDATSSTTGSGTADGPTKPPVQTGEVPAGATGGEGTTTGARNTPPPK